jgi:hypothetical protein
VEAVGELHKYDDRFTFQKVCTPDGEDGWLMACDGVIKHLMEAE